jgi:hypothetical protein
MSPHSCGDGGVAASYQGMPSGMPHRSLEVLAFRRCEAAAEAAVVCQAFDMAEPYPDTNHVLKSARESKTQIHGRD